MSDVDSNLCIDTLTEGMTQFTRALVRNQIRRAIRFGVERDEIMEQMSVLDKHISLDLESCQGEDCEPCNWHAALYDRERLEKKYDYLTKLLGGRQ